MKKISSITLLFILVFSSCTSAEKKETKSIEVPKVKKLSLDTIDIMVSLENSNLNEIKYFLENIEDYYKKDEEGNTIFHYFIYQERRKEDLIIFEYFLEMGIDFTKRNLQGEDIVNILIRKGSSLDYEMMILLKEYGYNFRILNDKNESYLIDSIKFNFNEMSIDIIEFLLKEGIDPNQKNTSMLNALSYLLISPKFNRSEEILELLYRYGLDVNKGMGEKNESALMWICANKDEIVNEALLIPLLNYGADPNIIDSQGNNLINILIFNKNINYKSYIAKQLIKYGADVNYEDKEGKTPIIHLTLNLFQKDNQNLIPILIGAGANINHQDKNGNTALSYAASQGIYLLYYNYIELLLALGADVNIKNNREESPIIIASKSKNSDFITINLLNYFGGNIDEKDIYGNTALSYSAILYEGSREKNIIDYLISYEADIWSENIFQYNPLMLAILYSNRENGIEAIKTLLPYYPSLNIYSSFGYTPLMVAANYAGNLSSIEAIEFLVEEGADINKVQENGTSPLMLASIQSAKESSLEAVKKIVELGGDPNLEIKKEWFDEEYNIMWNIGDRALELAIKYMDISSTEETIIFLREITKER